MSSKLVFLFTYSLSRQDCLSSPTEKNTFMLQAQAIDTLGILARNIGRESFLPLAAECIEMGKVRFHLSFFEVSSLLVFVEYHAL